MLEGQDPFRTCGSQKFNGSHRKRCQELIGIPRRFMNAEDGFVFPTENLLLNPRGADWSLSLWLFLTQDSTGKYRTIITRGHKVITIY